MARGRGSDTTNNGSRVRFPCNGRLRYSIQKDDHGRMRRVHLIQDLIAYISAYILIIIIIIIIVIL